jgi:hypothetical protein
MDVRDLSVRLAVNQSIIKSLVSQLRKSNPRISMRNLESLALVVIRIELLIDSLKQYLEMRDRFEKQLVIASEYGLPVGDIPEDKSEEMASDISSALDKLEELLNF